MHLETTDTGEMNATSTATRLETAANRANRPASFRYYLHDAVDAFRIELAGELTQVGLLDLVGCYRTAEATIRGRKVILDVRRLISADAAARLWLDQMIAAGAVYAIKLHRKRGFELTAKWEPGEANTTRTAKPVGRLRRWFISPLASTVPEDDTDQDGPWLDCRS